MMREVSNDFLNFKKANFPKSIPTKTQESIDTFRSEYKAGQKSTLDLEGLSCRARIYLLVKIIKYKRKYLPAEVKSAETKPSFNQLYKEKSFNLQQYWGAEQKQYEIDKKYYLYCQLVDKIPTTFYVGDGNHYELKLSPTFDQPGNGVITWFSEEKSSDLTYKNICQKIDEISTEPFEEIWGKIYKQKKDGKPIKTTANTELDKLLNSYSLLLDFEVARRKVEGDKYENLSLITCFPFLMSKVGTNFGLSFITLHTKTFSKIFEGTQREKGVKEIIKIAGEYMPGTFKEMRRLLNDFHQNDEKSKSYSSQENSSSQPYFSPTSVHSY